MPDGSLIPTTDVPSEFTAQMHMAQVLAESDLLPRTLYGKPANVLIILTGSRALNVPAFWALQSMHVIDGKLSMSADLMRALVIRAGHRFRVVERTQDKAVVEIHRKDRDQPYRFEFTYQEAKDAELTGKKNWKNYRRAMLVARATSGAVRDECPDVLFGVVYTPDELGADTNEEGSPVVDGEVVDTASVAVSGDDVAEAYACLVSSVTPTSFREIWPECESMREMPIDSSGLRLENAAADLIAANAREADSVDGVKDWYYVARDAGLLDRYLSKTEDDAEGDPPRELGNYLTARGHYVAEFIKAREAAAGAPAVVDVELPADDTKPRIDTENSRAMQKSATDSWGDGPIPPTGDDA